MKLELGEFLTLFGVVAPALVGIGFICGQVAARLYYGHKDGSMVAGRRDDAN